MRDKARSICELLSDNERLQEEREFARTTRDKLGGMSAKGHPSVTDGRGPASAAPASGKYDGFGSEDMAKIGYQPGKFNEPYDHFTKDYAAPG